MCIDRLNIIHFRLIFCHLVHSVRTYVMHICTSATTEAYGHQVPCERNSSYNFIPNLLKLYRCFCQGLKMCMAFGYNLQFNFCHFFHSLNLVIFGLSYPTEAYGHQVPCERNSSYNFIPIFLKLYRCFCQ